jgi:phosphatidylinositol 4-kinase type 2
MIEETESTGYTPSVSDGVTDSIAVRSAPEVIKVPEREVYGHPESSVTTIGERRQESFLCGYTFNWIDTHAEFLALVESCQRAIDRNIHPIRISQGSSGSYFVRDESGKVVGVFKPKDEEPYGQLNPKWIKWLHRTCCPCLFGRSFLMPNTGYISESAASLVDSFLGLNMVPWTQVAHLSSAAFVYPWWEHYRVWRERGKDPSARYPLKLGSYQLFVEGFEESEVVLAKLDDMRPLEPELKRAFQMQFEKMTILDYAIRNTDRSMENWLIHLSWTEGQKEPPLNSLSAMPSTINVAGRPLAVGTKSEVDLATLKSVKRLKPQVKIACIDNGLAFPFMHPHEWRSYPYCWTSLPEAQVPYSDELRDTLLPILSDLSSWDLLVGRLRQIFHIDADFDEKLFNKQMAILRGQLYNITEALRNGETPAQLVGRPLLLIDEDEDPDKVARDHQDGPRSETTQSIHRHRHTPVTSKPIFTCW